MKRLCSRYQQCPVMSCTCWLSRRCHRSPSRPRWQPAGHLFSWRPAWDPLVGFDWPPPSSRCPFPGEQRTVTFSSAPHLGSPTLTPLPYQLVPLPARLGLLLRQLCHFLFHVPHLPLHPLILLLLPVFCSNALVSLLRHLLEVFLQTTHQALEKSWRELGELTNLFWANEQLISHSKKFIIPLWIPFNINNLNCCLITITKHRDLYWYLTSKRLICVLSNSNLVSSSRILASWRLTRDFSTMDCSWNSSWLCSEWSCKDTNTDKHSTIAPSRAALTAHLFPDLWFSISLYCTWGTLCWCHVYVLKLN